MQFFDHEYYLFFLPFCAIVFNVFRIYKKNNLSLNFILLSSVLFYAFNDLHHLLLIVVLTCVNYLFCQVVAKNKKILFSAIFFNLFYLIFGKYGAYDHLFNIQNMIVAFGLSFSVIRQIGFIVDCFEERVKVVSFRDYFIFVFFFPWMGMGPWSQYSEFEEQLKKKDDLSYDFSTLFTGIFRFSCGLVKKVYISSLFYIPLQSNHFFDHYLSFGDAWIISICFTLQLYFDFSGYSDMAVGSAQVMGIKIPENFNSPLQSKSLVEFWSKWHISLGKFLATYIYSPLIYHFRVRSFWFSMGCVFLAFLVSGLWHGVKLTLITFGIMHACGVVLNHTCRHFKIKFPSQLTFLVTFAFIVFTNFVFKLDNVSQIGKLLQSMFFIQHGFQFNITSHYQILMVVAGTGFVLFFNNSYYYETKLKILLDNFLKEDVPAPTVTNG